MALVIIQPAAGPAARDHLQNTIYSHVPLTRLEPFFQPEDFSRLQLIFPSGSTQIWGVQPVQRTTWQRAQVGDLAYFSASNRLFLTGTVLDTFYNHNLAIDLWGRDSDGATWSYIYLLGDVRDDISIPVPEFNAAVGYEPNFTLRRFMVLNQERSNRFIDAFCPEARQGEYRALVRRIDSDPDRPGQVLVRKEQSALRDQLLSGRSEAPCAICSKVYPSGLLVAAHIKPRSKCSTSEKLDIPHIATLMCSLGCDSLYEHGYITVSRGVVRSRASTVDPVAIIDRAAALDGLGCSEWTTHRSRYFRWHESNVGR